MKRRSFIQRTAFAFSVLPFIENAGAHDASADHEHSTVRVGLIGLGAMGCFHLEKLAHSARVVALCDVHEPRLHHAQEPLKHKVARFADYRELLAFKDVEAVVIATPDHWHAQMTIDACHAGKDVYVETPAATNPADGRMMVEAARKLQRIVQVGAHGRYNAGARKACEYLRNGMIGRIERVVCWGPVNTPHAPHTWGWRPMPLPPAGRPSSVAPQNRGFSAPAGPRPATEVAAPPRMTEPIKPPAVAGDDVPAKLNWREWLGPLGDKPFNPDLFTHWRDYFEVGGGHLCGIGSQVLGLASWIMQVDETGPVRVETRGGEPDPKTGCSRELEVTWRFTNPDWELVWSQPGKPVGNLDHGAIYHGTNGTLNVYGGAFEVGTEHKTWEWKPGQDDKPVPFSPGHLANWLECIRTRQRALMDIEAGHRVATLCHLGNLA